jgi:hypothetical protein
MDYGIDHATQLNLDYRRSRLTTRRRTGSGVGEFFKPVVPAVAHKYAAWKKRAFRNTI